MVTAPREPATACRQNPRAGGVNRGTAHRWRGLARIGRGLGQLRPDIRRVSLLVSRAQAFVRDTRSGEALGLGCGCGNLFFPPARLVPNIPWTGVEHLLRPHFQEATFQQAVPVGDFVREAPPFPDARFSVITFSETLEHLPVERLGLILGEMERALRPGGCS